MSVKRIVVDTSLIRPTLGFESVDQVLATLRNKQGLPLLTSEQVSQLVDLKFGTGQAIFNLEKRELIFELSGLIVTHGFDYTYAFLTERVYSGPDDLLKSLPQLAEAQTKFLKDLENLKASTEGLYECPKCGSGNTITREAQTRSADEATTVFAKCYDCGKAWII